MIVHPKKSRADKLNVLMSTVNDDHSPPLTWKLYEGISHMIDMCHCSLLWWKKTRLDRLNNNIWYCNYYWFSARRSTSRTLFSGLLLFHSSRTVIVDLHKTRAKIFVGHFFRTFKDLIVNQYLPFGPARQHIPAGKSFVNWFALQTSGPSGPKQQLLHRHTKLKRKASETKSWRKRKSWVTKRAQFNTFTYATLHYV